MQRCLAASNSAAHSANPQAGIRDNQPDAPHRLSGVLEERAPARVVLLGSDAEKLTMTLAGHGDCHQKRHLARLASTARLSTMPSK
jgi:hypothetical protein